MLIKFSVENWQSFRDETTLSMVASREKQHEGRLTLVDKYKLSLVPVAAIYGGNASGKTKLFNAIGFAKKFVVKVTQPESAIPRDYFRLDSQCEKKPTKFLFEILIDNVCYEFSFAVTQKKVVEEKLLEISSYSEKILYSRDQGEINFHQSKHKEDKRLQFVADGTRDNQLFLTSSVDQKIDYFQSIYDWFKHTLVVIGPNARALSFDEFIDDQNPMSSPLNETLRMLDTGITHLGMEDISIKTTGLPEEWLTRIMEDIPAGAKGVSLNTGSDRIFLNKNNGDINAKKLVSYHKTFEGNEIPFEIDAESAGTQRVIDLLPALHDLHNHKKSHVYFIDELDRCMHTMLTRALLNDYLQSCTASTQSQLIFTTHDVLLMDQDLLRRDEIWVAERDNRGCSSLMSLGEYKGVRADKDIRKSYLKGSFGGIPKIFLS